MARLHIICGNCGCNDMWEWEYQEKMLDQNETVYISCGNCSTLHDLNNNANPKENNKKG